MNSKTVFHIMQSACTMLQDARSQDVQQTSAAANENQYILDLYKFVLLTIRLPWCELRRERVIKVVAATCV